MAKTYRIHLVSGKAIDVPVSYGNTIFLDFKLHKMIDIFEDADSQSKDLLMRINRDNIEYVEMIDI